MSKTFHNPYHFVPVLEPRAMEQSEGWLTTDDFRKHQHGGFHNQYQPHTHSGRIVCKLTTISPIFIGADRRDGSEVAPAEADHFELDGQPAIPSTSLRGLISSVAEAASSSALRVLENKLLTHRQDMKGSLSALGMVFVKQNQAGEKTYSLQPIALPTLTGNKENDRFRINDDFKRFQKIFCHDGDNSLLQPRLKVYLSPLKVEIPDPHNKSKFLPLRSYRADKPEFYYMRLRRDWQFTEDLHLADPRLARHPGGGKRDGFIIGQEPVDRPRRIILHQDDPDVEPETMVRGILRVLSGGLRGDMPPTKKHELFIPYPEGAEQWQKYPIPPHVVDTFHALADDRTETEKEQNLPFEPIGTRRNESTTSDDRRFCLKTGDIVYFDVDRAGVIREIALSSIWRGSPQQDSSHGHKRPSRVHDFFKDIHPELLPFTKGRNRISPAEIVFGFVEECKGGKDESESRDTLALKSLVRFAHGLPHGITKDDTPYLPPVTLKILAAPKPPSPNMYFKKKVASKKNHIGKRDLKVGSHHPQGRKFYLHHRENELKNTNNPPWKTIHEGKHLKQKVRIRPVDKNKTFWFNVDFENLDDYRLGMLCYGLQPSEKFHHKIGMGKPLGLGSVRIEPMIFSLINRKKRYLDDNPFAGGVAKYHYCRVYGNGDEELPVEYQREIRGAEETDMDFTKLRDKFAESVQPEVKRALELLGGLANTSTKVHTPLGENQKDPEDETFTWFVNNDHERTSEHQALKPLDDGPLPHLSKNFIRPNNYHG